MKTLFYVRLMRLKMFVRSNLLCCALVAGILFCCMIATWLTGLLDARIDFAAKEFLSLVKIDVAEVFAIIAVVISLFAMFYTKQINSSTFIASFWSRYWSTDMLNAIRTVVALRNDFVKKFPAVKVRSPKNNPDGKIKIDEKILKSFSWQKDLDSARRLVKGYYLDILTIYKKGVLSHSDLCELCSSSAYVLLFDVIEPMERVINENYNFKPFYELMTLCGAKTYVSVQDTQPKENSNLLPKV